jgi:hypothetical protein
MKSGNQHEYESTDGEKYDAGIETSGPTNIEKEPGDKDFQQQTHS